MNVEKLLLWADYIVALPHVGTPACIAGHVVSGAYPGASLAAMAWLDVKMEAADVLDLTYEQAAELFAPDQIGKAAWDAVTPTQAAACMRNLAATGIVDWPRALKENT